MAEVQQPSVQSVTWEATFRMFICENVQTCENTWVSLTESSHNVSCSLFTVLCTAWVGWAADGEAASEKTLPFSCKTPCLNARLCFTTLGSEIYNHVLKKSELWPHWCRTHWSTSLLTCETLPNCFLNPVKSYQMVWMYTVVYLRSTDKLVSFE